MPRFVPFLVLALAIVGTPVRTASRTDSWRWQMAFVDSTHATISSCDMDR